MKGQTLLVNVHNVAPDILSSEEIIRLLLVRTVEAAGMTPVKHTLQVAHFPAPVEGDLRGGYGLSGGMILVESHVYIHCVSSDTECLTQKGWKHWWEIEKDDLILTYNIQENKLEYQKPIFIYVSHYKGIMKHFCNQYIDALVTPTHKMLVKTRRYKTITEWYLRRADTLPTVWYNKMAALLGKESPSFLYEDDNFVRLLAWINSDGCINRHSNVVSIYQSELNATHNEEIEQILRSLNIKFSVQRKNSPYGNAPIKSYILHKNGAIDKILDLLGKSAKNFPFWVYDLPLAQKKIYVETLIKGDGSDYGSYQVFRQKNKKFIDHVQHLAVELGWMTYLRKHSNWSLSIWKNKDSTMIIKRHQADVPYNGIIWCPKVPNDTFVARRNNKVFITGNTWPEKGYARFELSSCKPFPSKQVLDVLGTILGHEVVLESIIIPW